MPTTLLKEQLSIRILRQIVTLRHAKITGDLPSRPHHTIPGLISCLITTAGAANHITALLSDLTQQTLPATSFEILLHDDSPHGIEHLIAPYTKRLPMRTSRNTPTQGKLGLIRNDLLRLAQGEFILFLDDDTRLPSKDFLINAQRILKDTRAQILLPYGKALSIANGPTEPWLDTYSLAIRCCCYRKDLLESLGGFRDDMLAYEDIELGIRANIKGARIFTTDALEFLHPPLFFTSFQKPLAIGRAILTLRRHYPFSIWLLFYLNALRFLPRLLWPTLVNRQWARISLGVLCAPFSRQQGAYRPF